MEVWNGQIMDVGLMVIGYFAAAGLGMVIYAALAGRKRRAIVAPAGSIPNQTAELGSPVRFIDLRRPGGEAVAMSAPTAHPSKAPRPGRRDRVEIVRLARQMLQAGTPADRVRQTLPISEAELTLLQSINGN